MDPAQHQSVAVPNSINAWALTDPGYALQYTDHGIWAGDIVLPAGRVELKFAADGAWTTNWGGGATSLVPGQRGTGSSNGDNIAFEIPISGPYRVTLDERSGAWSIAPAANLEQSAPAAARDFIALLRALPDLAGSAAAARVDSFVTAARAAAIETPLVTRDVALFLALGPDGAELAGDFTSWDAGRLTLVSLHGRASYLARPVSAGRHAYKLILAGDWQRDPLAPEIEWDSIPRAGYGDFNSVFVTTGTAWTGPHLRVSRIRPAHFSAERDVYVWLPPGYDGATRSYPTLYIHDGNESLTRSHFDQVAAATIAANRSAPVILVFVHLPSGLVRMDEYTFATPTAQGQQYADFLADELVPLIEQRYRARKERAARGLFGQSLGGLISYYAGYQRSDVFGRVGGMSSSFFWENSALIETYRSGAVRPLVRCYLDSGTPGDNDAVTRQMNDVLRLRGYDTMYSVTPGAQHDWSYWQDRFDEALAYLFSPTDFPN